eukprot:3923763-Rhodomonas_salina.1
MEIEAEGVEMEFRGGSGTMRRRAGDVGCGRESELRIRREREGWACACAAATWCDIQFDVELSGVQCQLSARETGSTWVKTAEMLSC